MKTQTLVVAAMLSLVQAGSPATPDQAVDELLRTDRACAHAAGTRPPVEALPPMFADDVAMAAPGFVWARGKAEAVAAMQTNPLNRDGRVEWAPVRGGVSADGLHGFTQGYMTHTKADGTVTPLKYLAYWVKGAGGWKVVAYNRRPRAAGEVPSAMSPPSLPARLVPPVTDPAALAAHERSLKAAEQAFSDDAQVMGIGPAFAKHGRPDAMNMGGPQDAGWVVGAEAIGRSVGAGSEPGTSPVKWNADRVLVASSGDLGVTFGMIRPNKPEAGRPAAFPFFTIWRRDNPSSPWRYIAE